MYNDQVLFFLTAADTLTIWPPQRADFLLRFFFAALSDDDSSSASLAFGSFGPEVVFDSGGAVWLLVNVFVRRFTFCVSCWSGREVDPATLGTSCADWNVGLVGAEVAIRPGVPGAGARIGLRGAAWEIRAGVPGAGPRTSS